MEALCGDGVNHLNQLRWQVPKFPSSGVQAPKNITSEPSAPDDEEFEEGAPMEEVKQQV